MRLARLYIVSFFIVLFLQASPYVVRRIVDVGEFTLELRPQDRYSATLMEYRGNQAVVELPATFIYNDTTYYLTQIGNEFGLPFYDNNILERITLPKSVTTIAPDAFFACTRLTYVKLGSVVEIGDYAFSYCTSLSRISFPVTLEYLGYGAFSGCAQLTSIVLPNRVNTIIGSPFLGTSLNELQILTHTPPEVAFELDPSGTIFNQCSLYVPLGCTDNYNTLPWSRFNVIAEKPQDGDINADGSVDVADVNILCNIILGKDDADRYEGRASVTHSASIDVNDVNTLINILLGDY